MPRKFGPGEGPKQTITIRLEPEQLAALERIGRDNGDASISTTIRRAVNFFAVAIEGRAPRAKVATK